MITKNPASRTLIVHPVGNLDALQADHYRHQLRLLIDEGYRFLIFDLADTSYINSSGLGLLVELFNTITRLEGGLKLINCTPHAIWLLAQTRLDRLFLQQDESAAKMQLFEAQFDPLHALMCDEILLLSQIHEAAEQVLSLDDSEAAGKAILQNVIQAMRAKRGIILLLDEEGKQLHLAHWQGQSSEESPPLLGKISLRAGKFAARILEQNEVTWHNLEEKDELRDGFFHGLGFETLLAAPIRGRLRNYGLLIVEAGEDTARIVQAAKPIIRTFTALYGLAFEKIAMMRQLHSSDAECRRMEQQIRDQQQSLVWAGKMSVLGVAVTGLNHLLNNKMAPLFGYIQILGQKDNLPEWVADKIAKMNLAGSEMCQVIEKLVRISHLGEQIIIPVHLDELTRAAMDLLREQIVERRIDVRLHCAKEPPTVPGDPNLLLQALLAILHRSCTSFDEEQEATERWIRISISSMARGLRILIEDNGGRLDDYDQENWLDPLTPMEAMDAGRFFSYAIPRNIVRLYRGTFKLESRPDRGKRVIVDLPVAGELEQVQRPD
jgi:anti-anti-sigma factor